MCLFSAARRALACKDCLPPREAANILGISYPTLKQWIYHSKIKTAKTPGGHHRVPESEIDRLIPEEAGARGYCHTAREFPQDQRTKSVDRPRAWR